MEKISWLQVPERDELPEDVQSLFSKAEEKLGHIPNVFKTMALSPSHFMRWFKYYDYLMRTEEGELSPKEREMIGLAVSAENRCEYCLGSHSAYLREITGDPILVDLITHNYRRAPLSVRERAMLDFAVAMTTDSYKMTPENLEPLRAIGLSDKGIAEVAQVAAMFNFTNRMANALGWKPNERYYSDFR
ncbi:MAG: peroxidase-related enzyme [Trueperaceae bacterium]|nr:peroxidase-related enzyme [Trueperaceae bacterium]